MKVTLIYPGITECGFRNSQGNEGSWINHGLCYLSAVLKKNGYIVSLIDLRMLSGWHDFTSSIENSSAGIFGITVMSVDFDIAKKCAHIIKKTRGENRVVFGGPHPSIAPEEVLKDANIDHVISGEGEISFLQLANDISTGRPAERHIEGQRPNLDNLPFADRKLFPMREEPFVKFLKPPFVTLIAGRGCSYSCNYCQPAERKIFGHKVRRRSVANVVLELEELYDEFKFNSFMFHDDCLTENKKWIKDFCAEYNNTGIRKQFVCQSRADLICRNRDAIKMLRDAGLSLLIIGFESGSQRMLDFIGKGTRVNHNFEAAKICHKLGIKIWANYMLGLPGETKAEQRMTLRMIRKIRPYHCSPAYYTPHPGSRLFDYCQEHNLSLIKNSEEYRRNTYEPKIRGINYEYLGKILHQSILYGEDKRDENISRKCTPKRFRTFLETFLRKLSNRI